MGARKTAQAKSRTAVTSASTSAAVLNGPKLARTVPAGDVPSAACIRGAQCSPERTSIPAAESRAATTSCGSKPVTLKLTTPTRGESAGGPYSVTPGMPRKLSINPAASSCSWRGKKDDFCSDNQLNPAPRPAMPGTFRLPDSYRSGIDCGCSGSSLRLPVPPWRIGCSRSSIPGAIAKMPVPSGPRSPLCPGAASKCQPSCD